MLILHKKVKDSLIAGTTGHSATSKAFYDTQKTSKFDLSKRKLYKNMGKGLLSEDYNSIVSISFRMPERDYLKYYSIIVDEHYENNPDIINELEIAINRWIDWYKDQLYHQMHQWYKVDEEGNQKQLPPMDTKILLFLDNVMVRFVNQSFFDDLLKIIDVIGGRVELKKKVLDFENEQPGPIREILKEIPIPAGFEYNDINARLELIKKVQKRFNAELEKE